MRLRFLLIFPLLLLLVLFAISNMGAVALGLWPLPASITLPAGLALLLALGLGVMLGAALVSVGAWRDRRARRRAEARLATLVAGSGPRHG